MFIFFSVLKHEIRNTKMQFSKVLKKSRSVSLQTCKLFFFSMFFTHLHACPCGSIINGHRLALFTIMALSTDKLQTKKQARECNSRYYEDLFSGKKNYKILKNIFYLSFGKPASCQSMISTGSPRVLDKEKFSLIGISRWRHSSHHLFKIS